MKDPLIQPIVLYARSILKAKINHKEHVKSRLKEMKEKGQYDIIKKNKLKLLNNTSL